MIKPAGPSYKFAYYCSGHGFGHATRVAATSEGLLARDHVVSIVSSAPESVFESILEHPSKNISYRFATFEPIFVQPKAYDVDRLTTFHNLNNFLKHERQSLIMKETEWLIENKIQCVLVDAPFLPCAAADQANIPSVIISNFTFDSCYSYLSAGNSSAGAEPIDLDKLNNLVKITTADYSCAKLLLRLPGPIPIPAFDLDIELPAARWVEDLTGSFTPDINSKLIRPKLNSFTKLEKEVIDIPLIVRPLTGVAFDPKSKIALLSSLGVPLDLLKLETKILLVSFGGQIISRPKSLANQDIDGRSSQASLEINDLLPPGWIAIICGLSSTELSSQMPERFYSLSGSKFDYIPDVTAIVDVVLGKLGYGTCSEVIATRTPFISVPRKKFLEEYGLKRWMKQDSNINIEMSIQDFEDGRWASYVTLADQLGHHNKLDFFQSQKQTDSRNQNQRSNGVSVVIDILENFLEEKLNQKENHIE